MEPRLLPAFRFEVTLLRSSTVTAGSQRLLGAGDAIEPPAGGDLLGNGGFQEVTGLELEMEMQDINEGGRNNGVVRRIGRVKATPLVLKRGLFFTPSGETDEDAEADTAFWEWIQAVVNGERPTPRFDGIIYVKSPDNTVRATWVFERGLPAKLKGPDLSGKSGEVAIEELHIAHEGLRCVPARRGRA
ncbi:phage tail protein [Falsiroseomonas sp. HW251]|uniref:phage tail protein n=1 Tax=Falsiroseomonas sp. HW251 TaxID=3390998 RepID=UPI003D31A4A1